MPVTSQFLDHMHHPWRQHVAAGGENARQFGAQEARPLPHRDPAVQQEGTNLIDDTGALADQSCSNPVQRLLVELLGCLGVQALQEEGRGDPQTSFLTASWACQEWHGGSMLIAATGTAGFVFVSLVLERLRAPIRRRPPPPPG